MTRIQVANLPHSIDDVDLRRLFEAFGEVSSAIINTHRETGRSTGVGFVEMTSERDGATAVSTINHHERFGRLLSACCCSSSTGRTGISSIAAGADDGSDLDTELKGLKRQ